MMLQDQEIKVIKPEESLVRGWTSPKTSISSDDSSSRFYEAKCDALICNDGLIQFSEYFGPPVVGMYIE